VCGVISVVTGFMVSVAVLVCRPSAVCDVISVVAEFMVSVAVLCCRPSVLCDVTSVVAEFMVSGRAGAGCPADQAFSVST
jgi:hypothetical protein